MGFFQPGFGDGSSDVCLNKDLTSAGKGFHPPVIVSMNEDVGTTGTPLEGSPLGDLLVTTPAVRAMQIIAQARKGYIPVVQS